MEHIEKYIGCNTEFPRMFESWSTVDQVMKQLDLNHGSEACPVNMNGYLEYMYKSDPIEKENFNTWKLGNTSIAKDVGTKCAGADDILRGFGGTDTGYIEGVSDAYFSSSKFKKYWEKVEKRFDCTGFCVNNYYEDDGTPRTISKYLFNKVNRGIPKYKGCMYRVMKWLKAMLLSFGVIALITGVIELGIIVAGCFVTHDNDYRAFIKDQQ